MGLSLLNKIAVRIQKKQNSLFTYPVGKQEKYIAHFPEPKDELERSYFQYCCQMKLCGWPLHWLMNLAALPVSFFLFNKYSRNTIEHVQKADCVFIREQLSEGLAPDCLWQRYPEILSVLGNENNLNHDDIVFLKKIFRRYPFSWMFWLKSIIKISQYSALVTQYSPKAIISCSEFSFTSSLSTKYCRERNIENINVMHGEKLYFMRDSFVCYDEYYVWDQYYVDLLTDMGAKKEQFRVELPKSMRLVKADNISTQYDYTYYLQQETQEVLQTIAEMLRVLHKRGKRISIRPHPRYSDITLVKELFSFANIEDCKTATIEQSLLQTGMVISLYSTVLNQAVSNAIPIAIDDISNQQYFKKLKELRYMGLNKQHKLLSALMEEE